MKNQFFKRAQELCREAQLYGNAEKWAMAMRLLRRATDAN